MSYAIRERRLKKTPKKPPCEKKVSLPPLSIYFEHPARNPRKKDVYVHLNYMLRRGHTGQTETERDRQETHNPTNAGAGRLHPALAAILLRASTHGFLLPYLRGNICRYLYAYPHLFYLAANVDRSARVHEKKKKKKKTRAADTYNSECTYRCYI